MSVKVRGERTRPVAWGDRRENPPASPMECIGEAMVLFRMIQSESVVIWGDDIGVSNIPAYSQGLMGYRTPHIDSIARN